MDPVLFPEKLLDAYCGVWGSTESFEETMDELECLSCREKVESEEQHKRWLEWCAGLNGRE